MSFELALEYLKKIEKERIRIAREGFEKDFFELIKKEFPEIDISELKLVWKDYKICPR